MKHKKDPKIQELKQLNLLLNQKKAFEKKIKIK